MQHPDENILELYVLNAPSVGQDRAAIEAHLTECEGCRILAAGMGAFYDAADRQESASSELPDAHPVITRTEHLPLQYDRPRHRAVMPEDSRLVRFARFAGMHPVVTGGGVLVAVGMLALAVSVFRGDSRDADPSFVHVNPEQGMVEVYNRERVKLWQLPGIGLANSVDVQFYTQSQRADVADVDGDARPEVLSCIALAGPAGQPREGFSILSASREVLAFVPFNRSIRYRAIEYPSALAPNAFVVGSRGGEGGALYVSALNARSPMVLARMDGRGEIHGEYWHFGHMPLLLMADVDNDGSEEIVMGGVDDTEDGRGGRFPVVAILDPAKIRGVTESSSTKGFGKDVTSAEKLLIRFPVSDLETAITAPGSVTNMSEATWNGQSAVSFWVKQRLNGEIVAAFEYIFSKRLQPMAVRSTGPSEIFHARLVQEGKLSGVIDSAYLENLLLGVRYWDGQRWSSFRTDTPASSTSAR